MLGVSPSVDASDTLVRRSRRRPYPPEAIHQTGMMVLFEQLPLVALYSPGTRSEAVSIRLLLILLKLLRYNELRSQQILGLEPPTNSRSRSLQ